MKGRGRREGTRGEGEEREREKEREEKGDILANTTSGIVRIGLAVIIALGVRASIGAV